MDVIGSEEIADAAVAAVGCPMPTGRFCGAQEAPACGLIWTGPSSSKQTTTVPFGAACRVG